MTSIALVMPTIDRELTQARNYLRETLEGLARSGVWESPRLHSAHLVDSGGSERWPWCDVPPETPITVHRPLFGERRTPNGNAAAAFRVGAEVGAEWVLFLEDDADPCRDLVGSVARWLDDHADGAYRVYTFASTFPNVATETKAGRTSFRLHAPSCFYGTVCLAMRAADAGLFASWLDAHPLYKGQPRSYDLLMPQWLGEHHPACMFILASCPSFVQHLGDESAAAPGSRRVFRFQSWQGREWAYRAKVSAHA